MCEGSQHWLTEGVHRACESEHFPTALRVQAGCCPACKRSHPRPFNVPTRRLDCMRVQEMRQHTKRVTDLDWSLENSQLLTTSEVRLLRGYQLPQ